MTTAEAVRIDVDGDRQLLDEMMRRACSDDPTTCQSRRESGIDIESFVRAKAKQLATEARDSSNRMVQTIAGLMNGLARIPGPKAVLLLSEVT